MTLRAALYARFSTDGQNPASIEGQLAACARKAAELGAEVAGRFEDAALSGQAMGNRPGLARLMAFAGAGRCDLVIAEHTDRLSRSGGDSWAIYEDLRALGVRIVTVNQGDIGPMHVGLSGTMSVLMIEEIARKTKRGLRGVVEAGRSAGGLSYGYRKALAYDAAGEPVRGLLEVDEAQAAIVRRIFRDYAAGASPRAIAQALNAEGVPGPRGGPWNASTIHGNAQRGNGVIHNELYRGMRVWGRQAFVKDRRTGRRRGRAAEAGAQVRQEIPALRIVDDALWARVRARYAAQSAAAAGGRPTAARRPVRLLSGLIRCGGCGGSMVRSGPKEGLRCATRIERGAEACANGRTPGYPGLEARVVAAIQANLLHPDVVDHALAVLREQQALERRSAGRRRATLERDLAEARRRRERLIDQLEEGVPWSALAERHASLETRIAELTQAIEAEPADVVAFHPAAAGEYRRLIERLAEEVATPGAPGQDELEARESREALRALIGAVVVHPREGHGRYELEIVGDLAPLLFAHDEGSLVEALDSKRKVGAGTRFTRSLGLPVRLIA